MTSRQRLQKKRLNKRRNHIINTWRLIKTLENISKSTKNILHDYALLRANQAYRNELNRIYLEHNMKIFF